MRGGQGILAGACKLKLLAANLGLEKLKVVAEWTF
jgi:hypothetical protein